MRRFTRTVAIGTVAAATLAAGLSFTTASVASSGPASTGTLFFSLDIESELYTIDTTDGSATLIGTTGVISDTVGLAEGPEPGVLLGSNWEDLTKINADGTGFELAGTDDLRAEGLAFDPVNGVLYRAINGDFSTADLTTGAPGPDLDAPGGDVESLAWRDDGTVLGVNSDNGDLLAYDIVGDSWSIVGSTGIADADSAGLAWDPALDILYMINGSGDVYSLDPDTAASTLIGNTGVQNEDGGGGGGLAFISAPQATATLVPGEPQGEQGSDVTFPVGGVCGDAAGNQVSVSIEGPFGDVVGPVEATTGADGTYSLELVVPDAPGGHYTFTGTCTVVGAAEVELPEATIVLGPAEVPRSDSPTPVPASPSFTG